MLCILPGSGDGVPGTCRCANPCQRYNGAADSDKCTSSMCDAGHVCVRDSKTSIECKPNPPSRPQRMTLTAVDASLPALELSFFASQDAGIGDSIDYCDSVLLEYVFNEKNELIDLVEVADHIFIGPSLNEKLSYTFSGLKHSTTYRADVVCASNNPKASLSQIERSLRRTTPKIQTNCCNRPHLK